MASDEYIPGVICLTEQCEVKTGRRVGQGGLVSVTEHSSLLKLLTISRFCRDEREREGGNDGEESIGVWWVERRGRHQDIKAELLIPLLRNLVQIDQRDNDLVSLLPSR